MNHLRNAAWMQERGHSVLVLGVADSPYAQRAQELNLPFKPVQKHKKYYDFKAAKALISLIQQEAISHLLIRANADMSITATVKRKLGKAIHTSYFMEMQLGVSKKHILHTIRYKYIDLWSCPLNWLKEQVETMTRFKNDLRVIPSGLDLSIGHDLPTKEGAREQLELPAADLIFGLIGRFDPQKGQLLLLEAMQLCKNTAFSVVLLGEPTKNEGEAYYQSMQSVAEPFGNRVLIRPFRKDIATFYTAIDWLVMATKAETFGMVTIESLACGTPVLGSNAGGTPELIDAPNGGELFTSMDAQALAKKLDQIVEEKLQHNATELRNMTKKFDHHSVCQQVENALNIG